MLTIIAAPTFAYYPFWAYAAAMMVMAFACSHDRVACRWCACAWVKKWHRHARVDGAPLPILKLHTCGRTDRSLHQALTSCVMFESVVCPAGGLFVQMFSSRHNDRERSLASINWNRDWFREECCTKAAQCLQLSKMGHKTIASMVQMSYYIVVNKFLR